jgi:hypothetical protein
MKAWEIVVLVALAVIYAVHSIGKVVVEVGTVIGTRLEELHEKVDAMQEKLDEIETRAGSGAYVNPIELDRRI